MIMMILAAEGSLPPFVRPSTGGDEESAEDAAENAASAAGQVSTDVEIKS